MRSKSMAMIHVVKAMTTWCNLERCDASAMAEAMDHFSILFSYSANDYEMFAFLRIFLRPWLRSSLEA